VPLMHEPWATYTVHSSLPPSQWSFPSLSNSLHVHFALISRAGVEAIATFVPSTFGRFGLQPRYSSKIPSPRLLYLSCLLSLS